MHFDELYPIIGGMGRYQVYLSVLGALVSVWSVEVLTTTFIASRLDHWCSVPTLERLSQDRQRYVSIPRDGDVYEHCKRFDLNYSSFSDAEIDEWNRTARVEDVDSKACDRGWKYDFSAYDSSAVNRFDLVCSRAWLIQFAASLVAAGTLFGASVSGILSDKIGRKKTMMIFLVVKIIGCLFSLLSNNYITFGLGRALIGFGGAGLFLSNFVLVMELVAPHYRTHVGVSYQLAFSIGMMIVPSIAYVVRHDRSLQLIFTAPQLVFATYWFLLPESPRWLLLKGRFKEARAVLETVARINGKKFPDDIRMENIKTGPDLKQNGSVIDLFRTPRLRVRTLVIYFHWFVDSLMYYGLSLNMADLSGNVFFNSILSGAVEIPANLLAIALLNWPVMGRRLTCSLTLLAAGLSSFICIPLILAGGSTSVIVMAMLGKAMVTIGFSSIYLFSTEIFPTEVRNAGLGSSSTCARISGMAAPFVGGPMTKIWKPLPHLIFGCMASLAGMLSLLLPETLNQEMCDTVAEAEAFVGGNKKKPADICESNEQPNVEPIHIEHDEKNAVGTELETETCKPQENPHKQDEKRENGMNGNHFLERNVDTTRL